MTSIDARGLVLRYRHKGKWVRALDGLDLQVSGPAALALTGPSGCGKSSLLAVLAGLQPPTEGQLFVGGSQVYQLGSRDLARYRAEQVGLVFQQFCLLPHLNLLENLLLGVDHLHEDAAAWADRARRLLVRVGVDELRHRYPHEVSGGQAQRAAIARALLRSPKLILADEPTGALDDHTAAQIVDLLLECAAEGSSLIVVTHSQAIAERMPARLALQAGRLASSSAGEQTVADCTMAHA